MKKITIQPSEKKLKKDQAKQKAKDTKSVNNRIEGKLDLIIDHLGIEVN